MFKNYYAIVFSVINFQFSTNKWYPKRPERTERFGIFAFDWEIDKKSESGGRDGLVESEFGIDKKKLVIYLGWHRLPNPRNYTTFIRKIRYCNKKQFLIWKVSDRVKGDSKQIPILKMQQNAKTLFFFF